MRGGGGDLGVIGNGVIGIPAVLRNGCFTARPGFFF